MEPAGFSAPRCRGGRAARHGTRKERMWPGAAEWEASRPRPGSGRGRRRRKSHPAGSALRRRSCGAGEPGVVSERGGRPGRRARAAGGLGSVARSAGRGAGGRRAPCVRPSSGAGRGPSARGVTNCSLLSLAVGRAPSGGRGRSPRSRAGPWTCVNRQPQPLLSSCRPRPAQRALTLRLFGVRPEDTRRAPGSSAGGRAGGGRRPVQRGGRCTREPAAQPARAEVQRTARRGKGDSVPAACAGEAVSVWGVQRMALSLPVLVTSLQGGPGYSGALGSGRDATVGPTDTVEFRNWECVELRKIHGKGR